MFDINESNKSINIIPSIKSSLNLSDELETINFNEMSLSEWSNSLEKFDNKLNGEDGINSIV